LCACVRASPITILNLLTVTQEVSLLIIPDRLEPRHGNKCKTYQKYKRCKNSSSILFAIHTHFIRCLHTEVVRTGPGLAAQIYSGPGRVQMIAIKSCTEHFGLSRAIPFRKEKVFRTCAHLTLMTQSGSGNKSHPPT
jgi:hypothetical protein